MVELKSGDDILKETLKELKVRGITADRAKKKYVNLEEVDTLELAFIFQKFKEDEKKDPIELLLQNLPMNLAEIKKWVDQAYYEMQKENEKSRKAFKRVSKGYNNIWNKTITRQQDAKITNRFFGSIKSARPKPRRYGYR